MLSVQSTRVVLLDSPTQMKLLSGTSKSTKPIHEKLLYANFVLQSPIDDMLIWGGGEKNGNGGIVLYGDRTTIIRRARAKPMLCRVLVSDDEDDAFEVWCVWSDNTLSRSRYNNKNGTFDSSPKSLFFLGEVSNVNDFVVLADPPPEVVSWKRTPRLVIICGSDPCLAVYHLSQNIVNGTEGKTLLAVAAASAITSVVSSFARKWLMDSPSDNDGDGTDDKTDKDEEELEEDRTTIYPKARFDDSQREMTSLIHGKSLCAASDGLGRIFVFRPLTLHVLRVLKGYRAPSLAFKSIKSNKSEHEWIDMLLVLAPLSRGNKIEVWRPFGGDSDTPFAFAKLPPQAREARLVSDSRGRHCALVTENEFLTLVDLDLDVNELDWDEFYGMIRSFLSSSPPSSLDVSSIEFPPGMFARGETVLKRFATIESSAKHALGFDFYLRFLQLQKQEFDSKNMDSQLISKRIETLQSYRKLVEKLSRPVLHNTYQGEEDVHSPRRWAMELTSSQFKSTLPGDIGKQQPQHSLATLILQPDNPNPYFDILISGDVFVVHEVETSLKRIGNGGIEQKYVRWLISHPVEWLSSAWRNSSAIGSNVLIKMALALGIQPQHVLDTCPSGRVELARAAVLCRGMSRAQSLMNQHQRMQLEQQHKDEDEKSMSDEHVKKKKGNTEEESTTANEETEWNLLSERLEKAFRIAVLLNSDEINLKNCEDEPFVIILASESCVPYHQTGRMVQVLNNSSPSKEEEEKGVKHPWERPSHPLDELKEIYSASIFKTSEKRDQFRVVVARKALSLGDYSMAMIAAREVEASSTLLAIVPDALNLLGDVPPCHPQLARLLMFLLKDKPAERDAVNALAMASEIRADAIYGKIRRILLSTALKGSSSSNSTKNEEETLLGTMAVELFHGKLALENTQNEDDEVLRVQGKSIGLKGEDEPSRYLATWHYLGARDARGNQCFDNIANDAARTLAAAETLKICRMRLSEFLRASRGNAQHASVLASLPPKTTSWLMSTSTASDEMIKPAKSPLRSTLSVLLKIEPHLPNEKPKDAASHNVVTPQERCVQLITLVESFLSAVNSD